MSNCIGCRHCGKAVRADETTVYYEQAYYGDGSDAGPFRVYFCSEPCKDARLVVRDALAVQRKAEASEAAGT